MASERATIRDLVTHRTGLPRHDMVWYGAPLSREEMFHRLRYLEPSKDFRGTWQYNNLMFMTAGYLAGRLAGDTWESLVRRRIFQPLEMSGSNFSVLEMQKGGDHSRPYQKIKEEVKEIPFRNIDEIGPAGSINSNLEDMSHYLLFHLNQGKYAGKQIVSENNVAEMHKPQMVISGPGRWKELGASSYGMGWMVSSYRGRTLVQHGGGIDGFNALVSFLPQEKIGAIVFVNRSGTPLTSLITYQVFDRLLGLEPVPWAERFKEDQKRGEAAEEEAKKKGYTPRKPNTRPSRELAEYAGDYQHPGYGVVRITQESGELRFAFNSASGPVKHFHYDVFEVPEDPRNPLQRTKIAFHGNIQGEIDRLSAPLESNTGEIIFTRLPARIDRQVLETLTGGYLVGPMTATVALKGESLTLTVPGQPTYDLVPVRGLMFNLKGLTGFSVEFKKDPSGAVIEMAVFQPNATFVAKRK